MTNPLVIKYSIIIPVLNETGEINALISHLRELPGSEDCEFIIVDGSSEGDTLKVITDHGIRCLSAPHGRASQMNAGAAIASGDSLIFLHADTRLPVDALTLIDQVMRQKDVVGGAFDLRICSNGRAYKLIAVAASLRSRMTRIPYGDQAIFVRHSYFKNIGGYEEIPLMEDVAFMQRIKKAGDKIHIISKPVVTSTRRWEKEGVVYTTLRNWILVSLYYLGVAPEKLLKFYKSGKSAYKTKEQLRIDKAINDRAGIISTE